jgi:peroxiredoxin
MMKLAFLGLIGLLLFSCDQQAEDTVLLDLEVTNPQGSLVKLEKVWEDGVIVQDSFLLDAEGRYSGRVVVTEPTFYRLNITGRQYVNLILDKADVQVVAAGDQPSGDVTVTGSNDTDHLTEARELAQDFQENVQMLQAEFVQARASGDVATVNDIQQQFIYLQDKNTRELKSKIWDMGNSIAAVFAVSYFQDEEKVFSFLDSLSTRFEEALPNSPYTASLVSKVNNMSVTAIGSVAPEIQLPSPDGDNIALSSLRGKYVLIDFWAAWCRPCRVENPAVVRAYNRFADKGFEVYGVSLDRKRADWLKAIEADGLPWMHVSDLKYWQSEAAASYKVSAIPATFLLDPEGRIIAKNLRGESLTAKLEEIFG